ncbi:MAG: UvrD-helicase domain-containing protein [bacterium]
MELNLGNLNEEQKEAVTFGTGPILIVAGAGTGKTTVITSRIAYLISQGKAKAEEILALTFTDKAAGEMEERIGKLLPIGYVDLWVSTFHSFAERILRENALDIGISPDFKLLDETQAWLLVRQNLEKFSLDYYRPLGNPTKFIRSLLNHFSRCKDEEIYPEDYLKHSDDLRLNMDGIAVGSKAVKKKDKKDLALAQEEADRVKEVAEAYVFYQKLLLDNNVLDFGDLINYCLKLFKKRPNILEKYRRKFKYILVDEFQDTNRVQYELVKILAASLNNLTVSADDDQCLPPETEIEIFEDSRIKKERIKNIKKGNKVLSAVGKGHIGAFPVNQVFKRRKQVRLLTFKTKNGYQLTVTDNHKMFCVIPRTSHGGYHYVYLMYRQDIGWRMGVTDDLINRLKLERSADKILAVKAFKTDREARYYETLWSLKYGIPTSCFQKREGIVIEGNFLRKLYKEINVEKNIQQLTKDLNIDLESFHYCLDAVNRGRKVRIIINLQMCYRKYRNKNHVRKGKTLILNPSIGHKIYLETSDRGTIQRLREAGYKLKKTRKGQGLSIESNDFKRLAREAEKIQSVTGGFLESKFNVAVKYDHPTSSRRNYMALMMPAKNLVLGHYLPVRKKNEIIYDQIIEIKEEYKKITVYDLEVDKTHNFIANGIVVHNSIYAWRGSSLNNVLQFRKDYPQAKEVILVKNYRSPQNVLDLSYKFIQQNNPHRLEYQISQVAELSRKAEEKGIDLQNFKKINKKLISTQKTAGFIEGLHFKTLEQEAQGVIRKVLQVLKQDKESSFSDSAILIRANNHAAAFCRELEKVGIPYQYLASKGLYSKPLILDIISYLKLISNLYESSAIFRVLNFPWLGISYEDIMRISRYSNQKSQSIYETIQQLPLVPGLSQEAVSKINFLSGLIRRHVLLAKEKNVSEVFISFMKDSGYLQELIKKDDKKNFDLLNQFYDKIKKFETDQPIPTLNNFITQLDLEIESGEEGSLQFNMEEGPDTLKIMTIHGAKGLEFNYVFLVNLVAQRFPSTERAEPIEIPEQLIKKIVSEGDFHLEEERRLFYVGMTRAKKGLFFAWADDYGGSKSKKPSRFLAECEIDQPVQPGEGTLEPNLPDVPLSRPEEQFLPGYFSHTQLAAFQNCPLQYKYAHILKIPRPGKASFSFGKTMHQTLYEFVKIFQKENKQNDLFGQQAEFTPDFKDLLKIYNQNWIDEWYESKEAKERYYQQGKKSLRKFYDDFIKSKPVIFSVEGEPVLEKKFSLKIGEFTVIGQIDRVDKTAGGAEIIDYKTGSAGERLQTKDKEQLLLYQIAAEEILGLKPEKLTYYYLDEGKKLSFLGSEKDKAEQKEKIISQIKQIKKSDFSPTPGWQCKFCDFKNICEYACIQK